MNIFFYIRFVFALVIFSLPFGKGRGWVFAQQVPEYTQYILNNYGLNPAAGGLSNNKYEVLVGKRLQWIGLPNNPNTSFFSFNTYVGKRRSLYRGWHGIGAYYQGDRQGTMFQADDFYASYSYHLRVTRHYNMAFGMAAGIRRYTWRITDKYDPVLVGKNVWLYPDFIPGIKLYNSKWVFDLSVKQLYKNKVKQGSNRIGSPTKLPPSAYITVSRKWWARSYLLVIQSVHLKYTYSSLPTFEYNMLAYLNKNFAVGMTYRHLDAIAAIVQFRWDKFVIGFAYDYTIAPYRLGYANSQELMMGLSPSPWNDSQTIRQGRIAECPTFQY
ncbi:MAG: PorP/SprF family type IX secretion system membrane protein [Bacteroidetes bacterium]|nr:PorP/SprF family type IX secretion system membrane protein [Bacteroidota bacterium]